MRKYGGELIYKSSGSHGPLEVVEDQFTRSLHFGDETRQSSMLLDHPAVLVLSYCRAMMSSLLFVPQPRRVLMVGLGAGSIAQFIHHHFDQCMLDVVELRQDVIRTAYQHFELPRDERIHIHQQDGLGYLRQQADDRAAHFDLILLDAFHDRGIDEEVSSKPAFQLAQQLLSPQGCMSINVSTLQKPHYKSALRELRKVFPGRTLRLPVMEKANEIFLSLGREYDLPDPRSLNKQAGQLTQWYGIEFPEFVDSLLQHNRWTDR